MPRVTQLTETVNSAFSGVDSIFLYGVYDGVDYRISGDTIQKAVGRRGGVMLHLSDDTVIARDVDTTISWNTVAYEDGLGWQDTNSPTCIFAPRPMVMLLQSWIAWQAAPGGAAVEARILKNNSENTGDQWPTDRNWHTNSNRRYVWSYPWAADSGDLFTCQVRTEVNTKTLTGGACGFGATPLFYL